MIKVRFGFSSDGKSIILTLQGHAGYAEKGTDIICSAATILAYTAAQCVKTMHDKGQLKKKPTINLSEGDISIVCKPTKDSFAEAMHIYFVVQMGYLLMANTFGKYITVKQFGQDDEELSST